MHTMQVRTVAEFITGELGREVAVDVAWAGQLDPASCVKVYVFDRAVPGYLQAYQWCCTSDVLWAYDNPDWPLSFIVTA
jgi:hypothetical protein